MIKHSLNHCLVYIKPVKYIALGGGAGGLSPIQIKQWHYVTTKHHWANWSYAGGVMCIIKSE